MNYEFIKNYKNIKKLRLSFNSLAEKTFGINFESWYQKNLWPNNYIPYSFTYNTQIISNASVNELIFEIKGEKKKAIQIGTVMTAPEFQGKGLAKELIKKIISDYKDKSDYIYLFANKNVLGFYEKLGFKAHSQYLIRSNMKLKKNLKYNFKKIDLNKDDELNYINYLLNNRFQDLKEFNISNNNGVFLWYSINIFPNDIYVDRANDLVIIYYIDNNSLNMIDILSSKKLNYSDLISSISNKNTDEIIFHCPVECDSIEYEKILIDDEDDTLFILGDFKNSIKIVHPMLAKA